MGCCESHHDYHHHRDQHHGHHGHHDSTHSYQVQEIVFLIV